MMNSRRFPGVVCGSSVLLFLAMALAPRVEGATHVWTGSGGNALWSNAANWSGGKPGSNEANGTIVQFGTNTATTCNIAGLVVDTVHFTGGGNVVSGTTALTIKGNVTVENVESDAGNNQFAASLPLVFSATQLFIDVAAGQVTIAGNCSGSLGFRKRGAGALTLTGSNTYIGLTEVAEGGLFLNSGGFNTALPGAVTVGLGSGSAGSAVLTLAQSTEIADTAKVTVGSDGVFQTNGNTEIIGALSIHDGKVDLGGGVMSVKGAVDMSGGSIVGSTSLLGLSGSSTVTVTSSAATGSAIIAPPISMSGGGVNFVVNPGPVQPELKVQGALSEVSIGSNVTKTGTGEMMLNNPSAAPNTYTGFTRVQKGTLSLNSNTGFAIPGALSIGIGVNPIVPGAAVVRLKKGDEIADTAQVSVYGDGVLDLSAVSSEGIATLLIDRGTVMMGDGSLSLLESPALQISGGTIASTGTGPLIIGGAVVAGLTSGDGPASVINPRIVLKGSKNFLIYPGLVEPELTLNGVVNDSGLNYGLTKTGNGTLLLTANNTYAGTTQINFGAVVVNGIQGSGAVSLGISGPQSTAFLGGSGVVGPLMVASDAHPALAPGGAAAPGALRVSGDATLGGATLTVRLDDNNTAHKCDLLNVSGNLNLTGATLAPLPVGAFSAGPYVIASYGEFGGTLTGTFAHVPSGYSVNYSYNDGTSSNHVALTVTNPYFIWAASYGLDPATTAVFNADPDHDGLANGIEFVLGSSPLETTGGASLPVAAVSGTNFVFTYRRNESAVYLNPVLEVSTTLAAGSWTAVTTGIAVATNFYGGGIDKVTVTLPMAGRARLFGRLRVDTP